MLSYKAFLAALILSLVIPGISGDQNPTDAALVMEEEGDEETEATSASDSTTSTTKSLLVRLLSLQIQQHSHRIWVGYRRYGVGGTIFA